MFSIHHDDNIIIIILLLSYKEQPKKKKKKKTDSSNEVSKKKTKVIKPDATSKAANKVKAAATSTDLSEAILGTGDSKNTMKVRLYNNIMDTFDYSFKTIDLCYIISLMLFSSFFFLHC